MATKKKAVKSEKKKPVEAKDLSKFIQIGRAGIKDGMSKMDAAREVVHAMKGEKRKHVVAAMMEGCDLSKAAAGTYYFTIQSKTK